MFAITVFVNDSFDATVVRTPGEAMGCPCFRELVIVASGQRRRLSLGLLTAQGELLLEDNFKSFSGMLASASRGSSVTSSEAQKSRWVLGLLLSIWS